MSLAAEETDGTGCAVVLVIVMVAGAMALEGCIDVAKAFAGRGQCECVEVER